MKYRLLGACVAAACCAAPAFAQGLTRVEILGLQQQLRDDGCGVTHVTGRMDAMTRGAVKKCGSKYSGATDARSMLAAMHIGFENGNAAPTMGQARAGGSMSAGGMSGSMNSSMNSSMNGSMNDSARRARRGMNGVNGVNGMNGMQMRDSTGRMRRGRMRDSSMMHSRDTSRARRSGEMMDTDKATPMTPPSKPIPQ